MAQAVPDGVAFEPPVEDGGVQLVAQHDDEAVEQQPQHDHQQGADRAVEQVVAVEIGQIDLESPGEHDEHTGGEDGSRGEEPHALFLHGDDVVDDAQREQGHTHEDDPAPDADGDVGEGAPRQDAVAEQPDEYRLVADKQAEHQHNHDVEQKHQQDAQWVLLDKGAALGVAVAEIEHHAVDGVGCKYHRCDETDGEEAGVLVAHDVVDGVGHRTVNLFGDDELQLVEQFVLQPVNRQEGNQGENEDEQGRQGGEERECQPFGGTPQVAVEDAAQQVARNIVEGNALVAGQGNGMHPQPHHSYRPAVHNPLPQVFGFLNYRVPPSRHASLSLSPAKCPCF